MKLDSRQRVHPPLLGLVLLVASAPLAAGQEETRSPSRRVASALQPFVDRHSLAGAVTLVASKEKVLDVEAVGFSDVKAGTPMRPDALFWIASQSKPITASALMMLVDDGKVRLDDPVEKYLPEFRNLWVESRREKDRLELDRPSHKVTVREILSHTAGMPFKSALEEPTLDLLPLRVAAGSYAMTPLNAQPGTKYQYSNAGINTAGRIIEVVGGMPYEAFLQSRLFGPLGMKDTTFRPDRGQIARLAKSYRPDAEKTGLEETTIGQLKYPLDDPERQPMPAGGLFSTAADLGRYCRMILSGGEFDGRRYLSKEAVAELTRKQTPESIHDGYGLGWSTGGGTFGHGGAFSTNMTIDPKRNLITIFLVQHAGFPADGGKSHDAFRKAALEQFGRPNE